MSPTDLSMSVADASQLSAGLVEVDDELMWCSGANNSAFQATLAPFGRGYKGTTAASHAANAQVRMSPPWPRAMVAREVNNAISGVYPMLYGVTPAPAITLSSTIYQFAMPDDMERVVDVRYKFSALDGWQRARAWEAEHGAPSDFSGDGMLSIYDAIPSGSTVQVLYAHRPKQLTSGSTDFSVTGLVDECSDVIVLATMARMARFMDLARLPNRDSTGDQRALGSATDVANDLFRQYQTRLLEEQQALNTRWPARFHKVR
jgi:hypothetical protein